MPKRWIILQASVVACCRENTPSLILYMDGWVHRKAQRIASRADFSLSSLWSTRLTRSALDKVNVSLRELDLQQGPPIVKPFLNTVERLGSVEQWNLPCKWVEQCEVKGQAAGRHTQFLSGICREDAVWLPTTHWGCRTALATSWSLTEQQSMMEEMIGSWSSSDVSSWLYSIKASITSIVFCLTVVCSSLLLNLRVYIVFCLLKPNAMSIFHPPWLGTLLCLGVMFGY